MDKENDVLFPNIPNKLKIFVIFSVLAVLALCALRYKGNQNTLGNDCKISRGLYERKANELCTQIPNRDLRYWNFNDYRS